MQLLKAVQTNFETSLKWTKRVTVSKIGFSVIKPFGTVN